MSILTRLQPALLALSMFAPAPASSEPAWGGASGQASAQESAAACIAFAMVAPTPAVEAPPPATGGCSESAVATPTPPNVRSKLFHQLRYHQSFPVHRATLLERAQRSGEIDPEELAWILPRLTAPHYQSPAEVFLSLFPHAEDSVLDRLEPASVQPKGAPALAQIPAGASR